MDGRECETESFDTLLEGGGRDVMVEVRREAALDELVEWRVERVLMAVWS